MNDTHRRLIRCFAAVFDDLADEQISGASIPSLQAWDSVAMVTLVSVVEEEFQIRIKPNDLDRLISFDSFCLYVEAARESGV